MPMTSRERVIAAIEFDGPDRVPHRHAVLPAAFATHQGIPQLLARYPSDFAGPVERLLGEFPEAYSVGQYTDEWQCVWTTLREGYLGQVTGHPLTDLRRLSEYRFPAARDVSYLTEARSLASDRGTRYLCLGWLTLFERMVSLCGFENLLIELAAGNPAIIEIRDRVVEHNLELTRNLLNLDPDGVFFADDVGTQQTLMISPAMWREFLLPAYRRQFEPVLEAGKHVFFHTDGHTVEILPDLVESGVNVFWVDLTVNPLDRLRNELGGRVCFMTLTDVQFAARNGTPDQVRQHAQDLIAALGSFNGGVIACHEINTDQPWENTVTILQTFHEDGQYPLNLRWTGSCAVKDKAIMQ